jgi:hypothetical protein
MESSTPDSELDALERTLLASIPLIRRARRNCLVVRKRARPQTAEEASSTARATEMTKQTVDVVQPHRFTVGEFVAFTEERLPGLVWAGEWEVVGILTGEHGEPQYRIRSPDQVRINVVAERDLPSRATAPALTDIVRSRRIGGDIVTSPPVGGTPGFEELFYGTSLGDWTMSTIQNQPGRDNSGSFLARRHA